jgi:hypothetical protein
MRFRRRPGAGRMGPEGAASFGNGVKDREAARAAGIKVDRVRIGGVILVALILARVIGGEASAE